jgi:hypothetical protein
MTTRLQIRIMAVFILVFLVFGGVFGYSKWLNSASATPSSNQAMKGVIYGVSGNEATFDIKWQKEIKSASAKNKANYYVEHVVPRKGKWLTAVNGKKCKISFAQHVIDKFGPKGSRLTQLTVEITPKPAVGDFFRVRARNLDYKEGGKMDHVEFSVVQVGMTVNKGG